MRQLGGRPDGPVTTYSRREDQYRARERDKPRGHDSMEELSKAFTSFSSLVEDLNTGPIGPPTQSPSIRPSAEPSRLQSLRSRTLTHNKYPPGEFDSYSPIRKPYPHASDLNSDKGSDVDSLLDGVRALERELISWSIPPEKADAALALARGHAPSTPEPTVTRRAAARRHTSSSRSIFDDDFFNIPPLSPHLGADTMRAPGSPALSNKSYDTSQGLKDTKLGDIDWLRNSPRSPRTRTLRADDNRSVDSWASIDRFLGLDTKSPMRSVADTLDKGVDRGLSPAAALGLPPARRKPDHDGSSAADQAQQLKRDREQLKGILSDDIMKEDFLSSARWRDRHQEQAGRPRKRDPIENTLSPTPFNLNSSDSRPANPDPFYRSTSENARSTSESAPILRSKSNSQEPPSTNKSRSSSGHFSPQFRYETEQREGGVKTHRRHPSGITRTRTPPLPRSPEDEPEAEHPPVQPDPLLDMDPQKPLTPEERAALMIGRKSSPEPPTDAPHMNPHGNIVSLSPSASPGQYAMPPTEPAPRDPLRYSPSPSPEVARRQNLMPRASLSATPFDSTEPRDPSPAYVDDWTNAGYFRETSPGATSRLAYLPHEAKPQMPREGAYGPPRPPQTDNQFPARIGPERTTVGTLGPAFAPRTRGGPRTRGRGPRTMGALPQSKCLEVTLDGVSDSEESAVETSDDEREDSESDLSTSAVEGKIIFDEIRVRRRIRREESVKKDGRWRETGYQPWLKEIIEETTNEDEGYSEDRLKWQYLTRIKEEMERLSQKGNIPLLPPGRGDQSSRFDEDNDPERWQKMRLIMSRGMVRREQMRHKPRTRYSEERADMKKQTPFEKKEAEKSMMVEVCTKAARRWKHFHRIQQRMGKRPRHGKGIGPHMNIGPFDVKSPFDKTKAGFLRRPFG